MYVLVGDMHVKRDNIEESRRVIEWIASVCKQHNALPIFMGDQHDTMSIVRAEVIEFWDWAYNQFPRSFSIEGNHDMSSDGLASAMTAHKLITTVINKDPYFIKPDTALIGYIRDNVRFIEACNDAHRRGAKYILCHGEFFGCQYENGFYAPHGINVDDCPPVKFISGHIHKKQSFGSDKVSVNYIGTPRMLTRSDIGEIKGVHVTDFTDSPWKFIPTPAEVAEPFQSYTVSEGSPLPKIPNSPKVYIDVIGSPEFVKKTCSKMPEFAKVRSLPQQEIRQSEIKESEGIPAAFAKYVSLYVKEKNIENSSGKILAEIYARCPFLKGSSQ